MKGGIGNIMKQAQKMQADMQKAQDEIKKIEVEGQSGGGMVKVIMQGTHEIKRVSIDDNLVGDDKDKLEALIAAAFNDAVHKLEQATKDKYAGITEGIPLPPGMKLPF